MERMQERERAFGDQLPAHTHLVNNGVKEPDHQLGAFTFRTTRLPQTDAEDQAVEVSKPEVLNKARESMVTEQMLPAGVTSPRILDAFMRVPRDQFIPKLHHSVLAYADASIPIGKGRYVMEPSALGALMQEAYLQPNHRVLDVACNTGYATAVLSKLVGHVTGVESYAELASEARANLQQLGINNADIVTCNFNDLAKTANEEFDVVLINGAVHEVPEAFVRLLREDGMIITIKRVYQYLARAAVYRKIDGRLYHRTLSGVSRLTVPLLPEFTDPKQFEF